MGGAGEGIQLRIGSVYALSQSQRRTRDARPIRQNRGSGNLLSSWAGKVIEAGIEGARRLRANADHVEFFFLIGRFLERNPQKQLGGGYGGGARRVVNPEIICESGS
jgi:hypothetical protein